jgi:flagellar protein FlaG
MDIELSNRAVSNSTTKSNDSQTAQNRSNLRVVEVNNTDQARISEVKPIQDTKEASAAEMERMQTSANELNALVKTIQRDLQFSVDDSSGETVIKVLDTQTDEVIRQIPSKEVLALTQNFESLKGILFSAEV